MPTSGGITPDDVRDALERLYENVALAQVPLAAMLPDVAGIQDVQARAQRLRSILLSAIELLQPARQEPFGSRAARSYEVLNLRYIEGMSVVQVADELSLVERQVYRDLRRAYEELAQVLRSHMSQAQQTPVPAESPAPSANPFQEELARLAPRPKRLDPSQVLQAALQAVKPLARRLGGTLECSLVPNPPPVSVDEGILKQVLIQMLSLALQSASCVAVSLEPAREPGRLALTARFHADHQPPRDDTLASLQSLAESQHLHWQMEQEASGRLYLAISLKVAEPHTILVVEDNPGAIELYRRYLAQSEEWQVVGATDPRVSCDMAARLRPAVIILDIMMPQQDGWTVLQLLRAQPQTRAIPIVVCSVFDDRELAAALGANAYLKKPVSQFELLATLRQYALADHGDDAG
ncbi:MAG: response regulator [Anaerolineae bacterium]